MIVMLNRVNYIYSDRNEYIVTQDGVDIDEINYEDGYCEVSIPDGSIYCIIDVTSNEDWKTVEVTNHLGERVFIDSCVYGTDDKYWDTTQKIEEAIKIAESYLNCIK